MKQLFSKISKIVLILMLIVLAIVLLFGLVLILDWPWWVSFFILLGIFGLGIAFVALRKVWLRRREQRFVQQVVDQDASYTKTLADKEKEHLHEVQERWTEAVEALKRSHLRKYGNPLYVLPWYLVIGESGSGKTTAIKSARLSSPFSEMGHTAGISGTRNCDWWFFEQAIILDTAGRYAIPINEGRDKEEWQKFLNLLAKYRKKEPLNGLIVNIAADKLLEARPETLEDEGRTIRRRIDELMRVLGAKPPVYILVTKCDLIQGMTQFCNRLPEKSLNQAMGAIKHDLSADVDAFQAQTVSTLVDRLRDFRLLLMHQSDSKTADPGLLLFPEEFESVKGGLRYFMKGAFEENPYQETPLLRGLFFSSGRQEGSPYSHFLKELGLIEEKEVLAGTNKGLFLHDFFARILPKDRKLFAPTQRALEWSRLTRSLGLTSWVAIGIAICGLLSYSFVKNMRTLREISQEFSTPPLLQGEVLTDVAIMDRFLQGILKVEDQNQGWWIPRFGLGESKAVEVTLKEKYWNQFHTGFLAFLDEEMTARMANFSVSTPDHITGHYVAHLVRRINLLKARLEGQRLADLEAKPQPSYEPLMLMVEKGIVPEISDRFRKLYLYYLEWSADATKINQEITRLQPWLKKILSLKGANLHWLVAWANGQKSLSPVSLEDFWGGGLSVEDETAVASAFTRMGKQAIDSFIQEIESALPDPGPPIIAQQKLEFNEWYRKTALDVWYDFGSSFAKGVERLNGREEWQTMAAKMPTDEGPYFALLDRMALEVEALAGKEIPSWAKPIYELQTIQVQAAQQAAVSGKGFLAKATQKGKKLISKMEGKASQYNARSFEQQIKAAKAYLDYETSLGEIASIAVSRKAAYEAASKAYNEDPAISKAPLHVAYRAISDLKSAMGAGRPEHAMFWAVVTGPLDYLWTLVRTETACHLQEEWNKTVLAEIQGISGAAAVQQILGQDGQAWKFVKGPSAPFIDWNRQKGYYATKALDGRIPFNAEFLSFLTQGTIVKRARKSNYRVNIHTKPTSANSTARVQPHATRLELKCVGSTQTLVNRNFPVSKTLDWSSENCEDVVLRIDVGDLTLIKKYGGHLGFPNFLHDFKGGKRTFFSREFPQHASALRQLGIKYINVEYRFRGHAPVLKLRRIPRAVPGNIVTCWD
jgi:type VI secretion system protein ImpL